MNILVIDSKIAGISGDMFLAALADLTASTDLLQQLVDLLNHPGSSGTFSFELLEVDAGGIMAKKLAISREKQTDRIWKDLISTAANLTCDLGLSPLAGKVAEEVLNDLTGAAGKVHPDGWNQETGSVDILFHVIGSLLLLDTAGLLRGEIFATPPVLGSGLARIGTVEIPCPVPITLDLLSRHQVPFATLPSDHELTTPTGIAILANIADRWVDIYPPLTPTRVGYGTGSGQIQGRPAVLRVVEGSNMHVIQDHIIMLETNLDDIGGETIGYTLELLREAGAVDAYVTQANGKKNRPVQILHIITDRIKYPALLAILMEETGTLGVRVMDIPRLVADRSKTTVTVQVGGRSYNLRVKTSTVEGKIISVKPEYEDLKRIATELHMPLRLVSECVQLSLPHPYRDFS
jgi:uncharacterized protein (TIGR00299 family) protein